MSASSPKKLDRSALSRRITALSPAKLELLAQRIRQKSEGFSPSQILPRAERSSAPLSFAQQRLWFLEQLLPMSGVYNIAAAVRIKGRLDVQALQRGFNQLVARHEALRTTFTERSGEPVQIIASSLEISILVADVIGANEARREAEMLRLATLQAQEGFDLERGPLMRVSLLRLAGEHHVLVVTMHHIISDAWSMGVIVREVCALYAGSTEGRDSELEEIKVQYGDYAAWQREWLKEEVLDEQLKYWREQLARAPALSTLPTDRPRPTVQSFSGAVHYFVLPHELSESIKRLSQEEGATLFMTLLAAFQILLHRYTGQEDIVVGSNIANRNRADVEDTVGFFVNNVIIRTVLSGELSFRELLGRVREIALGAFTHQDTPFDKLVEELQPRRDLRYSPLFQVMFIFQNAPVERLEVAGLTMTPLEVSSKTSKFDLSLFAGETPEGLAGSIEYNTDLFDLSTIERLREHFQRLLENIVAQPDASIASLSLVNETQNQKLINDFLDDFDE